MTSATEPTPVRRQLYTLLITVAAGMALGRILAAELLYEPSIYRKHAEPPEAGRKWPDDRPKPMPTFSSNDRSRWATVRALVEKGTYVIGHRDPEHPEAVNEYGDHGIVFEDGYGTVDKVLKPGTNEFYSTKPPLLPTLMAGEYWLLKQAFGWEITEETWSVVRTIVLTFNWLPWLVYLWLLSRLIERFGATDWGRLFTLAAAAFATQMVPFLVSINNHTVAAASVAVALYAAARIWLDGAGTWAFALAGFFTSFAACNELPALAFAVGLMVLLFFRDPRRTLLVYVPAAALPAAAFFVTNYLAIGELAPVYSKFGTEWYEYEGSHWSGPKNLDKPGIDYASLKETRATYAFHLLLGHHGLFSLTPIYLLALAGMLWGSWRVLAGRGRQPPEGRGGVTPPLLRGLTPPARLWSWFAGVALVLSAVVVGFYLFKSDNYGGWSNGPRWLLWLTPFWLLTMLPIADRLSRNRAGRVVAYLLLAASALSAHYFIWNPWRHPWIFNWMDSRDLIPY